MATSHKETLALGSDTRPPVLFRGEYQQWKERFNDFIDKHDLCEEIFESIRGGPVEYYQDVPVNTDAEPNLPPQRIIRTTLTQQEQRRKRADKLARSYLIQSLPNDIFNALDSGKTAKEGEKLEDIRVSSTVMRTSNKRKVKN